MRRRNNFGSRFYIGIGLLIVFFLLCALYSGITGNPSPTTRLAGFVTTPVQRLATGIGNFLGKGFSYFTDFDDLKAENEQLHKQIRDMEQTVRDAALAIEENNRLRQQLGQPRRAHDYTTITAEVIGRNPGDWAVTLTLDKGSSHGVAVGNLVMTEDGVVGYVSSVQGNNCEVVTVVDIEMQCGALVTRTRESAIAEGNYDLMVDGNLRLSYLQEGADVVVGDTVETSGRGGVFPKGIMIGTVERVMQEENGISMYAVLKPFVDVTTVTNVSIITAFSDTSDLPLDTQENGSEAGDADNPSGTEDTGDTQDNGGDDENNDENDAENEDENT